ncbi:caudovirus prohead protease [Epilithonimonas vandammei]|uniref:Caudovirus prohead protease n=1 Tax=Epilithonimonas vandammei TaxID=2487072 RepID=A0A3G8ZFS8_9FLAO|nr:HK97 family phage prohead protease [Epilithonimonas vandammei]AZI53896.1 caudovirus prohead protease [Epilithonimonas vandammei]AZI55685.1 caudovirus prohead protease [Epilithonimonas vandammei]
MSKKRFVFNDENIKNSYGFFILTSGIDTRRFSQNPVILADHWNWTGSVLGTWEDMQTASGQLSGTPKFDTKTYEELVRQVESGTLKGCSMGILFDEADFIKKENGDLVLTKCELMEVSIVAVPSNANSIALYHQNGNRMSESEVKTLCLSLGNPQENPINNSTNNNDSTMKKIQLSLMAFVALGFAQTTQSVEEPELDKAILTLKNEYDKTTLELNKVKQELQAFQDADKLKKEQENKSMVSLAVQEGRITADKAASWEQLAAQNPEATKIALESLPKKVDLSTGIITPTGKGDNAMTDEDFQKLDLDAQLAWKEANPEAYKKLFS